MDSNIDTVGLQAAATQQKADFYIIVSRGTYRKQKILSRDRIFLVRPMRFERTTFRVGV